MEQAQTEKVERRGRPRSVFTDEVLESIPLWLAGGADRYDIADAIGTTAASLADACSKHGISLNPAGAGMRRGLGPERWEKLRAEAARRDVPVPQLIVDLVAGVVDYSLFGAVLSDHDDLSESGDD